MVKISWPCSEAHNAGKGILGALTIRSTTISGGDSPSAGATCDSGQPGRSAMYFSNSDVDIDFVTVQDNAQGLFFKVVPEELLIVALRLLVMPSTPTVSKPLPMLQPPCTFSTTPLKPLRERE